MHRQAYLEQVFLNQLNVTATELLTATEDALQPRKQKSGENSRPALLMIADLCKQAVDLVAEAARKRDDVGNAITYRDAEEIFDHAVAHVLQAQLIVRSAKATFEHISGINPAMQRLVVQPQDLGADRVLH